MAQAGGGPGSRRRTRPEAEEVTRLQQFAVEAATAYRDYMIGGDPARKQRFWDIYNRSWGGATLHDSSTFMNRLFDELDRVGQNEQVRPLLDAFIADRGRLFGFLWRNPAHFTDFIDTVYNIRTRLGQGAATDQAVATLAQQYRDLGSRPVRADTPLARVRESVQGGRSVEDAARAELERPAREDAVARYGEALTQEVAGRLPREQARRAAIALRNFMLTGDDAGRAEFRRIFDSNTTQAFTDLFTREFTTRIYNDTVSGLAAIAQAYNTRHNGTEPNEFATMVANLYRAASSGTVEEIERMRQAEGSGVIDPLLRIVAQGMAGRAIGLLRRVLESGDTIARDQFVQILNGRLATVANNTVQMPGVEGNDVFWAEFTRLYNQEISQNSRLATLVRSFQRNILPIAIRDVYIELARATPDMARLNADYGPDLIRLVAGNMGSLTWLLRSESGLNSELARRVRAEDSTAVQLSGLRVTFPRGRALAEVYAALLDERQGRSSIGAPEALALLEQNFDQLSWLSGDAAAVQRELDRRARARPPDALAQQLRARFPQNTAQALSQAYRGLQALRQRRAQLVQSYGQEFVDIVSRNLDNLSWVVRPVEEIESEMRSRRDDAFVQRVNTTIGYSVGTLAHALRDIYSGLGGRSPDTAGLGQRYGAELVQFVQANRARLGWLGGDIASVERALQDPTTDLLRRQLQARLYSYTPVQLVSAIARARAAISRGGLALADARDAYGTVFVAPVAARQAVGTPSLAPEAAQARQAEVESRARSIEGEFESLESQLRYSILEPARALLRERIRLWRQENNAIRLEARQTQDPAALNALVERQRILRDSMLTATDLRRAVEMSFAMIHLAETGADLGRGVSLAGITSTDTDIGTLRRLMEWYRGLGTSGKQPVIAEVVGAVLNRADPRLYQFITRMDEPGLYQGISRVYALTQRRGADTRQSLVGMYGEPFVALVEALAPNLRVMESPSGNMGDLQRAENALFANITIRCYRALANPREGENRETMVRFFGEEFVRAVEAQRAGLSSLAASGAGLAEVRALPQDVRQALMAAYPSAYNRSVGSLMRAFRNQDEWMFRSASAVYAVLRNQPPQGAAASVVRDYDARVQELYAAYGQEFVRAVATNIAQLGFLESPSASVRDLSRLSPQALEALHTAFERGPGAGRANFMNNFARLSERLPRVYAQLRSSLIFSNPSDTLSLNFTQALQLYRQEFGSDNYLILRYINIDLLSRSMTRLARRYNVQLPPYIADGIDTPEELAQFLGTEPGRQLITAGRQAYEQLERAYLQERQDSNFHPTTGDFTDANVTGLRNELSIIDALYMGIALERISGTDSAFQRAAATAVMNSILVISHRDPYLVGPYLLQVLPAIISVAQDERTLVAAIEAFNAMFTQRYEAGTREIAYSTELNRRYFLEVFARIGQRLPEVVSTFDHDRLQDELRLTPEPRTDAGYRSPLLYRYRRSDSLMGMVTPPTMYGQYGAPIRLLPRPTMPTSPFLPVPGGFRLDSGAMGLFSDMYDQLRPPVDRMFRQRVPPHFRIGALGASTIIRRINQLFGPMPVDYNDYWLSGAGETGGFYAHGEQGAATRNRAGAAGVGMGRTISGGVAGQARYTREEATTAPPAAAGAGSRETTTTTDTVDVTGQAVRLPSPLTGPVPLPVLGLVPYDLFQRGEGVGIHRARQEFHYERAGTEERVTPPTPPGGPTTVTETQTRGRTRGLLDSYQRIARESQTDMLLFVAGEHVPELRGPAPAGGGEAPVAQAGEGRLKSRLYFITREGDVYQLAYGLDTRAQLLNYLYAGANTQQFLASARTVGRHMLTGDSALAGFDGMAVGFTVPRSGGDTFSALALGQLVRSMSNMDPVHAEQAVGMAVTNLLASRRQRDVYAGFYRGAEIVTMDQRDRTHISDSRFAEGTGEVMWRRVRIDPMAYQAEVRGVGGYPLTVGARGRFEWRPSRHRTNALGITAAYSHIDLLREVRAADADADRIYGGLRSMLVSLYGWSEDEARDTGWLAAGSYLYARMEDWTVRGPDGTYTTSRTGPEGTPENHFASAMFMYWAQRHGMLVGAQRVPGWSRIYDRIDRAMTEIQRNPTNEATILQNLSQALRQDLQRDIWRIALAYGYDGERVRIYTLAGGQWTGDETAYGNLYGLALIGRPTRAFADILGHAYGYAPLVISENTSSAAGFDVRREPRTPFLDLYGGLGILDWPSFEVNRYERRVTVRSAPDAGAALRDVYRELGGTRNRARLVRNYGERLVALAEEGRESLSWMIRPSSEVRTELQTRLGQEDPVVMTLMNLRRGALSMRAEVRQEDAEAIIDIYRELRKANPDRERLTTAYSRELVERVEGYSTDLDFLLLPPQRMRSEFTRRAQRSGTTEARIASEAQIPAAPGQDQLTGPEVKRMMEQNMPDVLAAATDAQSRVGLTPERYDVLLGSHLGSPEGQRQRAGTFYILHTPVSERAEARGSLVIGDETDLDEWMRHGHQIGRGISRLEISREGSDYRYTFSGDRRARALTAARLVGGVTIPIRPSDLERYQQPQGWTVGGLVHVLQTYQQDWLAGAMYGTRQFGNEQWNQWTVTVSARVQGTNTATFSDQWYGYVFFNQANRQIVFASGDVFSNADEMRDVCQRLGGSQCTNLSELSRTTGGVGLTWARADVITGNRLSLHLFFEGGAETYRRFSETGAGTAAAAPPSRSVSPVFRTGAGIEYVQQSTTSVIPNIYSLSLAAQSGTWPLLGGEVTRPEMLQSWSQQLEQSWPGWSIMAHGRVQW